MMHHLPLLAWRSAMMLPQPCWSRHISLWRALPLQTRLQISPLSSGCSFQGLLSPGTGNAWHHSKAVTWIGRSQKSRVHLLPRPLHPGFLVPMPSPARATKLAPQLQGVSPRRLCLLPLPLTSVPAILLACDSVPYLCCMGTTIMGGSMTPAFAPPE